ncbi:MAG: sulfotransferase [Gammaproteobacteria bacterium]|nr:sulfotransferase [Gammaproteobacteria bacterium]
MSLPADKALIPDELQQAAECMRIGQVSAAASLLDPWLQNHPQDYHVLHLAGTIAIAENRHADAVDLFRRAIAVAPDAANQAMSWNGVGHAMSGLHQNAQAEEAYRRAMLADPGLVTHALDFAQALSDAGKHPLAMDVLQAAIRRHPRDPAPCARLGSFLVKQGRQQDALVMFDMAMRCDPLYAPAHFNASVALVMLGKTDEAYKACDTALKLDPNMTGYYQLAGLGEVSAERLAMLESRAAADSGAAVEARIDASFALASAYNRRGDPERAFGYLSEANRLKRGTVQFDVEIERDRVQRLKAFFTPELFARFAGRVPSALRPIFIIGMPRSGSTLVEQMLAGHPQVQAGGEMPHLPVICHAVGDIWGARGAASPGSDEQVVADLNDAVRQYAQLTEYLQRRRQRFTDKLLGNYLMLGMIELMFPQASIIHTHRNPFDTCLSCYERLFTSELNYTYDLADLGRQYCLYEELMAHWHAALPAGRILDVEYEALVAEPETGLRRILEHCGLPFDAACLKFHEVSRPVTTASAAQVRRPIYQSSAGRWRLYKNHLQPLAEALQRPLPAD